MKIEFPSFTFRSFCLSAALGGILAGCQAPRVEKQVPLPPRTTPQTGMAAPPAVPAPSAQPEAKHLVVEIIPDNKDQAFATRLREKFEADLFPRIFFLAPGDKGFVSFAADKPLEAPAHQGPGARFYPVSKQHALESSPDVRPLEKIEIHLLRASTNGEPRVRFERLRETQGKFHTVAHPGIFRYPQSKQITNFSPGSNPFPEEPWLAYLSDLVVQLAFK